MSKELVNRIVQVIDQKFRSNEITIDELVRDKLTRQIVIEELLKEQAKLVLRINKLLKKLHDIASKVESFEEL